MSKHTQGPWQAREGLNRWNVTTCGKPRTFNICAIATQRTEQEANARLIAAAPELLEMCKMMAAEYTGEDGVFFERHPAIGRLIEVIAKATGEA